MTPLPQPICGHALQDPSTDSRNAKKWKPGNTGTRTRNTGRQRSEPGEGTRPAARGADGEREKAARGDGLGRLMEEAQGRGVRPANQGRSRMGPS